MKFPVKIPGKSLPTLPTAPLQATEAFSGILKAWADYKQTAEIEGTKREQIRAWRDVHVTTIEKNTEILKEFLHYSFSERRETIDRMFETLDKGIESGNSDVISGAMNSIISITKTSPLAGVRELLADFNNPAVKEIEI